MAEQDETTHTIAYYEYLRQGCRAIIVVCAVSAFAIAASMAYFDQTTEYIATVQIEPGCSATVYAAEEFLSQNSDIISPPEMILTGMALPASLDGDHSIILIEDPLDIDVLRHELGHSEQMCKLGLVRSVINWWMNNETHEQDADTRGANIPGSVLGRE